VFDGAEVALPQSIQGRTVELGLAADVGQGRRSVRRHVIQVAADRRRRVLALGLEGVAAFDDKDFASGLP